MSSAVASKHASTERVNTHYLEGGAPAGFPVLFLHGNCSSSRFFQSTLAALPARFRGIAPDLRGYGHTEGKPVDATRGLRDFSDDLYGLIQALGLGKAHLVGWSVGAGVAMQLAIDHPEAVGALVLESPVSPYGFGGTRDAQGTPCFADFAGSGGGTANPEFVKRLGERDRGEASDFSPRKVMNAFYFKPPFRAEEEEALVEAMLTTRVGEANYPGGLTSSPNWPTVAPGTTGMNNAISPKYLNLAAFAQVPTRPDVLWIRGADDQIVSDTSLFDFGFLGSLGAVPGWPGQEAYPPQPMIAQMRAVLERYRAGGGRYLEEVLPDCGHSPHLEKPEDFRARVFSFLADHC